jgi:branched-chain amino acid transport system permease protein
LGQLSFHCYTLDFSLLAPTGFVYQEKKYMTISEAIGRQPKQISLILIALSASAALSLLIPSLWGEYARILFFTILLYVIMAVSYDVVGGLLGYLYLGHGFFFGLGAYITALALKQGQPLPLALLFSACLTLPVAAALSFPLFRLQGAVFALATLGLLFLGGQLASNLPDLTGGAAGLSASKS